MNKATTATYTATKNACKLCAPLGAALVFKGIRGAVPLLHGSQGCSTYIRRYLISHFKEPVDIACSNFAEETAIFGGGANLKIALENIRLQYAPELVGVATTCLSETIGDDVPMFVREYQKSCTDAPPPIVHVATPSYRGTHMDGFHDAVRATVEHLAEATAPRGDHVNVFPGMMSPVDLRHIEEILTDFGLPPVMLPNYASTLDGPLWTEYNRIPDGGTPVTAIKTMGSAQGSLEFGRILGKTKTTAARQLEIKFKVPRRGMGLPIGVNETDRLYGGLEAISGRPTPTQHREERGRLIDSYVDGHKYVSEARVAVYGEEDLVASLTGFLLEIGAAPVLCASGGRSGHLQSAIDDLAAGYPERKPAVFDGADFVDIEKAVADLKPDLLIGSSKGYAMARRLNIPLVRVGFPVHDRFGGPRILHLGYRGTQQLFDRIVNALIAHRQASSPVGYSYM